MNKKGFTLVELLAVIVILAVVMLIGGTTVLPMMQKAQKSALGTEGVTMKKSADTAFQTEIIKGHNAAWTSTEKVCFPLVALCDSGNYDKGCTGADDGYKGSVLIDPTNTVVAYKIWISNETYSYSGLDEDNVTDPDNVDTTYADVVNCNGEGKLIRWNSSTAKFEVVTGS